MVAQKLARADIPETVVDLIRVGRFTSLKKPDGGVRGIVAGDVVCRLVPDHLTAVGSGGGTGNETLPVRHVDRAGCECVAHALQGLTDLDQYATVTSVDGISAFDMISRQSMMEGLHQLETPSPFVRLFYGRQSQSCLSVMILRPTEGGEQGDAMMPLLFFLGQHRALQAVGEHLQEHLFAYLDNTFFVKSPFRVGQLYAVPGSTECARSDPD